jgi:hypothetical protein
LYTDSKTVQCMYSSIWYRGLGAGPPSISTEPNHTLAVPSMRQEHRINIATICHQCSRGIISRYSGEPSPTCSRISGITRNGITSSMEHQYRGQAPIDGTHTHTHPLLGASNTPHLPMGHQIVTRRPFRLPYVTILTTSSQSGIGSGKPHNR